MDKRAKREILIGGLLWLAWSLVVQPTWPQILLLLSPIVLFPLGLALIGSDDASPKALVGSRINPARLPAAILAALSFVVDQGSLAAILSLPWLAYTAVLSGAGIIRFLSRRSWLEPGVGADAALGFVVVGGAWLTLSRAGATPMGFDPTIVQLTAVHFHYAGFALPIVSTLVGHRLGYWGKVALPWAVIFGVPITAIGIIIDGTPEFFTANLMATIGLFCAFALLREAIALRSGILTIASIALAGGMVMAGVWATTQQFAIPGVTLELMARTHGTLNALGFGFLGLLGLLVTQATRTQDPSPASDAGPTNLIVGFGRASPARIAHIPIETELSYELSELKSRDNVNRRQWGIDLGDADGTFEAASDAMRRWIGHDGPRIVRNPEQPPIVAGERLRLAIPVGLIYATATCEIVDVTNEPDRFGFSYGTLRHHFQQGQEWFLVQRDESGHVRLTVDAIFISGCVLTRLAGPIATILQNRAINAYLEAVRSDTTANAPAHIEVS